MPEKESVSHWNHKIRDDRTRQTRKISSGLKQSTKNQKSKSLTATSTNNSVRLSASKKESPKTPTSSLLNTGDKVRHDTFGDGIIINTLAVNSDIQLTVAFDKGLGIKKLLDSIANLKKISSE